MKRRLFSLLLTGAMLFSMCPPAAAAGPDGMTGGLCSHHQEHSYEACGYVEAVEEIPCNMNCAEIGGDGQIIHVEGCAYTPAVAGRPCGYVCRICPVQAMIDALPDAEGITPDNRAGVEAQLEAIDTARAGLTDEEAGRLDTFHYQDIAAALSALDGQVGADVPVPIAAGDVTYLYCSSNGQNWQSGIKAEEEYTFVTAEDTTWGTADTESWYVVNSSITLSGRVAVNGTVHLILMDGHALTAEKGIRIASGNTFNIYAQSQKKATSGQLFAVLNSGGDAAIGANGGGEGCGAITINGGVIETRGGSHSSGIGGGANNINGGKGQGGAGGNVVINGGFVTAYGSNNAAGIGGGEGNTAGGDGGTLTINGGIVFSNRIGGGGVHAAEYVGCDGASGTFSLTGGIIVASGIQDTSGISGWNGVVISDNNGGVYGTDNFTLDQDMEIPQGYGLMLTSGQILTVAEGVVLMNSGAIINSGTISGSLTNKSGGGISNNGTISGPLMNDGTIIVGKNGSVPGSVSGSGVIERFSGGKYLNEKGEEPDIPDTAICILPAIRQWKDGWYVMDGDIAFDPRVTVSGDVHLILTDNCTLSASSGINVSEGNSLTIYGQSGGTGTLEARKCSFSAGIGGGDRENGGTIIINGGTVNANGGDAGAYYGGGAGIGGGYRGDGGEIIINGGTVNASGGQWSAGIGGGYQGNGGQIIINGGTVNANGGSFGGNSGAGIGDGYYSTGGTFSTGTDGSAFITASSISDKSHQSEWTGLIFIGNSGQAYGNPVTLTNNVEIPANKALNIPGNSVLVIPDGVTLTNKGEITNSGTICGALMNNGIINNPGTISGTLTNDGRSGIVNSGTIDGVLANSGGGAISSSGTISGTMTNDGTVIVSKSGSIPENVPGNGEVVTFGGGKYLDAAGTKQDIPDIVTFLVPGMRQWQSGWYMVYGNIELSQRAVASGDVHLILADGCSLNAGNGGIEVSRDNSLTIYCQTGSTGALTAVNPGNGGAAIGANRGGGAGSITINGGNITATVRQGGACIGMGGWSGGAGSVTVNGGYLKLTANVGEEGAFGSGGTRDINGGIIEYTGRADTIGQDLNNCVVFKGTAGEVYGDVKLTQNYTIPRGKTLNIPESSNLTVGENVTLTDDGTIKNLGKLIIDIDGEITGRGTIQPDEKKLAQDAPITGEGYDIDYIQETLTAKDGHEVSSSDSEVQSITDPIPGNLFYVRKKANNFYQASQWTSLGVDDRPSVPTGLQGVNTSFAGEKDGRITGLTAGAVYQISSDSDTTWKDAILTGTEITGLAAGNYQVRVKAVESSAFASKAASVTIGSGDERTYTLDVIAPAFDDVTYGYSRPAAKPITITSTGNSDAAISKVEVSDTSKFTISGSGDTVTAGNSITTWTVQPNAGLSAGEHTATITVSYNNGVTAEDQVSFKVNGAAQDAPAAGPVEKSKTYNSVTLETVASNANGAAAQYSKDGGITWQDSPAFTGLTPSTKYTFVVRYGAIDSYEVSPASAPTEITTDTAPVTMYSVTVNGGTGGGSYAEGTTVTITATIPSGQRFTGWTVTEGGVTLANAGSTTTTFTMPAQAVTVTANFQSNSGGGSSGGGGGSYTPPTYPPTVEKPSEGGGAAAVSPSDPKQGDTVTITPKPDSGYEVYKITVTDRNGRPVEVTKRPDGTYTFKQPSGKVKIEVSYKAVEKPWSSPFADVSEDDWYYEAVRFVHERGLMNGHSDGRFGPNDNLSRAQLAQILFNKEGRPGVNYLLTFSDVAGEAWYAEAIRWAASQGIVGGYGNGTFGPNDPITREQLAVMLWRYSGSPAATNKELHFNDESEISGFALEALRWAVENGILNGYGDGRLGPQGQATRAQVAQMLKNFIEDQENKNNT